MPGSGSDPTPERSAEAALMARLQNLHQWVNSDDVLVHRGRFVTLDFQIAIGTVSCFVSVVNGKLERIEQGPQRMRSSRFVVSASAAAWEKFWQPTPEPSWHDLFAMNKKGNATIEGDLHPFMANLQYFKDLLALPRHMTGAR
jgi:hypothetical protein